MRGSHVFVFLLLAASAPAQTTITNVTNAANRIAGGARTYGIAQGSLFVVVGKNVGPTDFQQASFPLPTTDGLAGVTVQASVGGAIVDAIMVYISATEVAAILPSSTPLGSGTVTLNNNGATASAAITVVASAFGIFTYKDTSHSGLALVFNVSPGAGSATLNSTTQSAQAGQDILVNGTGLGAIASDETQSGVADIPGATIQVYVGVKPGTVVSAGRGSCCDGLDPSFPVPQGIAAWDVIRLTIPDGVAGCFIPVVVQIGKLVSNLGTISITPGGGACVPALSTLPPELTQQLATQTGVSLGSLAFGRTDGVTVRAAGGSTTTKKDTGSAGFSRINAPASMFAADYLYPENVCSIGGFPGPNGGVVRNGTEVPIVPLTSVTLDAGPAITVSGPTGRRTIMRLMVGTIIAYDAPDFGNATPGNYYDPGHYTVTGTGGKDVGAFTTSFDVPPTPFTWTNTPDPATQIDRSKDLTINWTGGIPGTQVVIDGGDLVNGVSAAFQCAAPVSAGQLIIPSYVLLSLPPNPAPNVVGQLSLLNRKVTTFTVSGLDIPSVHYASTHTVYLRFQ